jgi:hypothetical protein
MSEAKKAAEKHAPAGRPNRGDAQATGSWFGQDVLAEVRQINLQVCRWLRAQVAAESVFMQQLPLLHENRVRWLALDDRGLRDLSGCPCVLLDADFANPAAWESIAATEVRDGPPSAGRDAASTLVADAGGRQLARLTLQLAWHLARFRPVVATVTLGMPVATAIHLQGMRLVAMDVLPDWLPALVRPRWHGDPRAWAQLLAAAQSGLPLQLESARVGALQLVARQLAGVPAKVPSP